MKSFLFISDFDGTMTAQDFFFFFLYRYEHDRIFSNEVKSGFDLLQDVFCNAKLTESQLESEIQRIPLDPNFASVVEFVDEYGGDFLILSAGCKYYIERKLCFEGINNVRIIANGGFYADGGLRMIKDENSRFYSTKFGIDKFAGVKVANLSTGMKQKVSLVVSIAHDPDIIIFDEPTNGLDVITAKVVTDFLKELKEQGKTIILSTHIFSLVEKLCDRAGIIIDGVLTVCSDIETLTKDKSLEDVFFDLYYEKKGDSV